METFWILLGLLIMLGIGIPIVNTIYQTFTNTTNGTWLTWTVANATGTGNVTAYTQFELGYWQLAPIIMAIMILIFILMLVGGRFKREQPPM